MNDKALSAPAKSEKAVQGTEEAPAPRDVGAVVNALQILQYLAATTSPVGVAAMSRATNISTSTCFTILRTLTRTGFASFNPIEKSYKLGLAMAGLAAGLVGVSHAELIRPELERLALNYDTLILLWRVTDDNHLILIDRAHSRTAIRVEISVGYRHPLLAGAIGRCVAANLQLTSSELRRRFAALRWQTPLGFAAYESQVEDARNAGWGIDEGYLIKGITTVAALVPDGEGRPWFGLGGVSISGHQSRERLEALGRDLGELASLIRDSFFPMHAGTQKR